MTTKRGWTTSDGGPELRMNPELLRQGTTFRRIDPPTPAEKKPDAEADHESETDT